VLARRYLAGVRTSDLGSSGNCVAHLRSARARHSAPCRFACHLLLRRRPGWSPTARVFLYSCPAIRWRGARVGPTAPVQQSFIGASLLRRGSSQAVLHCAHRATTASSWGLCEQEGRSGCSLFSFLL